MDSYDLLPPCTSLEYCDCATLTSLLLVDLLSSNPLHCGTCRKQLDSQRLQLTDEEMQRVADWFSAASALYRLWLHSGEYESYAKQRLSDPQSQINVDGLSIARSLSQKLPTRLWFFHDADDPDPTHCTVCGEALNTDVKWGIGCCDDCRIQV